MATLLGPFFSGKRSSSLASLGWGGRIRTFGCGIQSPEPYRLATPQWREGGSLAKKSRGCRAMALGFDSEPALVRAARDELAGKAWNPQFPKGQRGRSFRFRIVEQQEEGRAASGHGGVPGAHGTTDPTNAASQGRERCAFRDRVPFEFIPKAAPRLGRSDPPTAFDGAEKSVYP